MEEEIVILYRMDIDINISTIMCYCGYLHALEYIISTARNVTC